MRPPFGMGGINKMRAIGRGLLWLCKAIPVLFIIVFMIHGITTLIIGRRFAADVAAIKAKGDPVAWADLAGKPVPKDQNAAIVYAKAFKMLNTEQAKKDIEVLDYFFQKEKGSQDQRFVSVQVRNIPDLWSASKLAAQRFEAIVPLTEEAQARPKCKFPVDWDAGPAALFPHYAKLRNLTRVLGCM